MTTFKYFATLVTLSFLILVGTSSCKKKKAFKEENAQTSVDVRMFQGQTDEALADINLAIMGQPLLRGKNAEFNETSLASICGLDLDTSLVYQGKIRLDYNGNVCRGVKRTGAVQVTFLEYPTYKWKNPGATLKIEFIGYKAVWTSDGRTIQIDGTVYLKNESGKTWYDLQYLNVSSLVQVLTGSDLKITYSGGNTADFNVNRRMEYTYDTKTSVTTCMISGLGSYDTFSNVENHGITRDGLNFYSVVNSPVIWRSSCGAMAPIDGEVVIKLEKLEHELKCIFSVDSDLNETDTDNPCPYGWHVEWSYKKKTNTRNFSYY